MMAADPPLEQVLRDRHQLMNGRLAETVPTPYFVKQPSLCSE